MIFLIKCYDFSDYFYDDMILIVFKNHSCFSSLKFYYSDYDYYDYYCD